MTPRFLWKMWIIPVFYQNICEKNPHPAVEKISASDVDHVDKSELKQVLPHIYDISGAHSYQQVTVHTIFQ